MDIYYQNRIYINRDAKDLLEPLKNGFFFNVRGYHTWEDGQDVTEEYYLEKNYEAGGYIAYANPVAAQPPAPHHVGEEKIVVWKKIVEDILFVKGILPDHYTVEESKKADSVHCKSSVGIRHKIDDDDEHWSYIFKAIKQHFGERFQEVYHNTCFCHVDFTIYLKQKV